MFYSCLECRQGPEFLFYFSCFDHVHVSTAAQRTEPQRSNSPLRSSLWRHLIRQNNDRPDIHYVWESSRIKEVIMGRENWGNWQWRWHGELANMMGSLNTRDCSPKTIISWIVLGVKSKIFPFDKNAETVVFHWSWANSITHWLTISCYLICCAGAVQRLIDCSKFDSAFSWLSFLD